MIIIQRGVNRAGEDYISCSLSQLLRGGAGKSLFPRWCSIQSSRCLWWKMFSANSQVICTLNRSLLVYYFSYFLIMGQISFFFFAFQFSSVQSLSCVQLFATPWITARQASLSITNSRSLFKPMSISWWCHPAISSSVIPFSSCPQSLPASGSFPMSQLFTWGGQSIGVSASASVLPVNTQDWSPVGWTGWISLQPKGLSRVFSRATVSLLLLLSGFSRVRLCATPWRQPTRHPHPCDSPGKNTGVGCHFLTW